MRRVPVLAAVLVLLVSNVGLAQFWDAFNPRVGVSLVHPPGYGQKLTRVAFAPAHGRCASQLLDPVVALFVDSGIEVVDRRHLESLFGERRFDPSGSVDARQAAELGRSLGPGALLVLNVTRCETEKKPGYRDQDDGEKGVRRTFIATTRAELKGSLQVVDLTTGRVLRAEPFESLPSRQVELEGRKPEFPPENELLDEAIADVVNNQVRRLFFPWNETLELIYYDDSECGMKHAHQLLKAGDTAGALQQSLKAVEACKATPGIKPKYVGRAHYNVGMSYFLLGDYDRALASFEETVRLNPGNIVAEAIAECRRARQTRADLQQYEERANDEAGRGEPAATSAAGAQGNGRSGATSPGKPAASPEERLERLRQLYTKGLINKTEYETKKAEIIREM